MIPLSLKLSGFLSYREPVEIDFTGFDLACISGENGAGKSSLLDAITWVLFGQARKRDDSLINLGSQAAEVAFQFGYEENVYRVQRSLARGKTTVLEFQIRQSEGEQNTWRPLSERTLRETQARLESILRLDYETFVNAAFFLQGKADQFTQQSPGKRKDILSNVLGLNIWEVYRDRATDRRRRIERSVELIISRVEEIDAELSEEAERKARLADLERQLAGLSASRKSQESALDSARKVGAALETQRHLVATLSQGLEKAGANLAGLERRIADRDEQRKGLADLLSDAEKVETGYRAWIAAREDLERWEGVAGKFREQERLRQPFLEQIAVERARLEQEKLTMVALEKEIGDQAVDAEAFKTQLQAARQDVATFAAELATKADLEELFRVSREQLAELGMENKGLKTEMELVKERIGQLQAAEGAECPVCGQPLSPEHRESTLTKLDLDGKRMGDRYRENRSTMDVLTAEIERVKIKLEDYARTEREHLTATTTVAQLTEKLAAFQKKAKEWKTTGKGRLKKISGNLDTENFAGDARVQLSALDKELAGIGYDAAAHDTARKAENDGRVAEEAYRRLESARAAFKPLDEEITNLHLQMTGLQGDIQRQQAELDSLSAALAAMEAESPDYESIEKAFYELQERENLLNQEVGAARQKVIVLDDLRQRKSNLDAEREELIGQAAQFKTLERAFGKDGVPAMLIEQALPEIETKANELLDRLSGGTMSVRFVTQAAYRDKNREDLKETLEIQISDAAGVRDYEMFSGGEAFRINFAIRLALSEVLARRKGARLQTLVIDEGFGSQDAQGRQRLVEAINAVRPDFAKILVITHLDELKDAFPHRIEVTKTERGSVVQVV